jgi:hypothetical protein
MSELNLYQKISEITSSLGAIQKDSSAPAAMGGYRFISHGMVLAHLRTELTKHNVVIRPSGEELLKTEVFEKRTTVMQNDKPVEKLSYNFHTIIKYKFTVVDGDNPNDLFEDYWIGEGMDSGDKGVQKSGTSAEKYYLMKLFKVGDKDDPDASDATGNGTVSTSAAIRPPAQTEVARPAGSPGAFSHRAVAETRAAQAASAPAVQPEPPTFTLTSEVTPDQLKAQVEALVWLGEQLPPNMGWFRGKIVPMVQLWDVRSKNGSITPEDAAAGSGINWVFNQLAAAHHSNCGEGCEHLLVPKLAILTGGTIVDPAKTNA